MKNNLTEMLLIYIAYCLTDKNFLYEKFINDLKQTGRDFSIKTVRKEFSLIKKAGLIEYKTFYKKPYPILSQKGRFIIKTRLPMKKYDWDGFWKMVIFEIPKQNKLPCGKPQGIPAGQVCIQTGFHPRGKPRGIQPAENKNKRLIFQQKLIRLGFGKISRGVYICPHPIFGLIKKEVKKLKITNYVFFAKTNFLEFENEKINKIWDLIKINEMYSDFILKAQKKSKQETRLWPLYAKELEKKFILIYAQDPHLPNEFLPKNWLGQQAYSVFKAIANSY